MITGAGLGSVDWSDFDKDGDMDVLVTGTRGSEYIAKIFINDAAYFRDINAGTHRGLFSRMLFGGIMITMVIRIF